MTRKLKAKSAPDMPQSRRKLATDAALLTVFGSVGPFAGSTEASNRVDADKTATIEDYAKISFEPIPGLAKSLGSRSEWLAKMGDRYPTLYLGAATMRMTTEEVTAMAASSPDAIIELMQCLHDLHKLLQAESEMMNAAFIRLMSGCCRAGLS